MQTLEQNSVVSVLVNLYPLFNPISTPLTLPPIFALTDASCEVAFELLRDYVVEPLKPILNFFTSLKPPGWSAKSYQLKLTLLMDLFKRLDLTLY